MWLLKKRKWYRALMGGTWYYNRTRVPDGLKYQFGPYTYKWSRKRYPLHKTTHTLTIVTEEYFNFKLIYRDEWDDRLVSFRKRRKFSFVDANYQDLMKPRPWDDDPLWPL